MSDVVLILIHLVFWPATAVVLFTTLTPLTNSVRWWIRGWDFPRIHIAIVALVLVVCGFFLSGAMVTLAMLAMAGCAIYQLYRVFPYTFLAKTEIELTEEPPEDSRIKLLSANVLMENRDYDRLLDVIDREDPDILFLMETDQAWVDATERVLDRYDHVTRVPKDNHYGLVFATRLDTIDVEAVYLADDDTPTVLAELDGPTGPFYFVGLHPRPPVPGNTTKERDEQVERAANLADRSRMPVIAMGDFNDAAWSWTSERFKRHGDFLDPRAGRGLLCSFDARSWFMRFPIDQLYVTKGVDLVSFARLEAVGSDHFPMKAVISIPEDVTE